MRGGCSETKMHIAAIQCAQCIYTGSSISITKHNEIMWIIAYMIFFKIHINASCLANENTDNAIVRKHSPEATAQTQTPSRPGQQQ